MKIMENKYYDINKLNDNITIIATKEELIKIGYYQAIEEKDKEIERLNNIINELEKYVIENSFGSPIHNTCVIELSKVLDKIKELKGEDKE